MTRIQSDYPLAVRVVGTEWIPLSDGTRLAVTLWLPETAEKCPVVVELIPYRRRDGTVFRDVELHPYLAGHGIGYARVDLRGSGDSDGILSDEYTPLEQQDCCEVIAWLASRDWCNGNVGMCGISWGGFNSLQVAALQPPALKAIMTLCATDDRHSDDVHYMGGSMLNENISWSNVMMSMNALPPDPQIRPDWREVWQKRLEANSPWALHWIAHSSRDDYWRQGSICEDYSRVVIPVYAAAGWDDSYSNFVLRLLENLAGPRLGLLGPWSHAFPCRGTPGPHIGWLQECLRWWQHWLTDQPNDIMEEPMLRVWLNGPEPIAPSYDDHAGRWISVPDWPAARPEGKVWFLNRRELAPAPVPAADLSICSLATAGLECGRWGGYGGGAPDLPTDQRREDAMALCFDSQVFADGATLLGRPVLDLALASDRAEATFIARLCEVSPDGASRLISYGVLNLNRRNGMDRNDPMPVGQPVQVRLVLDDLARDIAPGSRLRLALSNQHWPILWPKAGLATFTLAPGQGRLSLPLFDASQAETPVFEEALIAGELPTRFDGDEISLRSIERDIGAGTARVVLNEFAGTNHILDRDISVFDGSKEEYLISENDPSSAVAISETRTGTRSGPVDASIIARTSLRADATHFTLEWSCVTSNHGTVIHEMQGSRRIPRGGL